MGPASGKGQRYRAYRSTRGSSHTGLGTGILNSTPSIGRMVADSISEEQRSALQSCRCVYGNVICGNVLCRSSQVVW